MGTHYSHLSQTDRVAIQLLLQAGCSRRQIADKLGFSPSTICREIIRGKSSPTALPNSYRASAAQSQSQGRLPLQALLAASSAPISRRRFGAQ
jgi:IS30 family transposase